MSEHDFSPISDHCTACALPIRCWEMPCRPSVDDSPEAVAEIERAAGKS